MDFLDEFYLGTVQPHVSGCPVVYGYSKCSDFLLGANPSMLFA